MLRNARGGGGGVYAQALRSVTKHYEGVGGYLRERYVTSIFLFLANNFGLPACPNSKPIITTQ